MDNNPNDQALFTQAKTVMAQRGRAHQQRVVIFGASFNPITVGHLAFIALLLQQSTLYDIVCVIPAGRSPLKLACDYACSQDRLDMLELAIKHHIVQSDGPRLRIDKLEIESSEPSRMILTLAQLIINHQGKEQYTLACGYDHLLSFEQWYRWSSFFELCELAFYPRQGIDIMHPKSVGALRALLEQGTHVCIFFTKQEQKILFSNYCVRSWGESFVSLTRHLQLHCDASIILPDSASSHIRAYYRDHTGEAAIAKPAGLTSEVHDYIICNRCYQR